MATIIKKSKVTRSSDSSDSLQANTGQESQNDYTKKLEEQLVRALADYQNLERRIEKDRIEIVLRANKNLLKDLLPIVDNLDRAQDHLKDQGLKMALDQLFVLLKQYGVEEIVPIVGEAFNSNEHEAIEGKEGPEAETIAEVLVKGYKWRDGQVIRPAKVTVFKGENK